MTVEYTSKKYIKGNIIRMNLNLRYLYRQKRMYLEKILRKDLLPHLGEDVQKKIRFLGLMVHKYILFLK